ncbi:hypothetical protein ACFQU7_29050 [Pseudoroseomonas wenyumeiae]
MTSRAGRDPRDCAFGEEDVPQGLGPFVLHQPQKGLALEGQSGVEGLLEGGADAVDAGKGSRISGGGL